MKDGMVDRGEISRSQRWLARLPPRVLVQLLAELGADSHYATIASTLIRSELRGREILRGLRPHPTSEVDRAHGLGLKGDAK